MEKILIKKLHPEAKIPVRATEFAAGWDLFCAEITYEAPDVVICHTGLAMRPADPNYRIVLVPRSSLTKTRLVMQNSPGIGDPDYTGEYKMVFRTIPYIVSWGATEPDFRINVGDRIGQMYLERIVPIEFQEVEDLGVTARGDGGFGSTGVGDVGVIYPWSKAPKWAKWAGISSDGIANWYSSEPVMCLNQWFREVGCRIERIHNFDTPANYDWANTKQKRP
ncbi:MAG: dUTP diphosphatase [Saprospiraceae bacterium]